MRTLALALLLATLWLLMSGHYDALLLSLGAIAVGFVVAVSARLRIIDRESVPLHLVPRMPTYAVWLLKEIVVSNLAVARRILSPRLRIAPSVIRVPGDQPDDVGRALYANSITLTPGTITAGVDGDDFTIHALVREGADDVEAGDMNRRVTLFEGKA